MLSEIDTRVFFFKHKQIGSRAEQKSPQPLEDQVAKRTLHRRDVQLTTLDAAVAEGSCVAGCVTSCVCALKMSADLHKAHVGFQNKHSAVKRGVRGGAFVQKAGTRAYSFVYSLNVSLRPTVSIAPRMSVSYNAPRDFAGTVKMENCQWDGWMKITF